MVELFHRFIPNTITAKTLLSQQVSIFQMSDSLD